MRITNNMMVQTMIRNINRNMLRLNDKQIQFSTGKRINRPSDDPLGLSKSLRLRTDISSMEQYKRNVDDAYSFMDNTETALQNMLEGMHRIRELTVQAASGTLTKDETQKMQTEITEIRTQLIDLANYTYSGKHIFSGKKTGEPLLDRNGNYLMDLTKTQDPLLQDDKWSFEITTRERVQVNTLGFEVFEAEEREVLYQPIPTGDFLAEPVEPATANWTLELPYKEGDGTFVLEVLHDGGDQPPTKQPDGTWTVGADWQDLEEDPVALVEAVMKDVSEIIGPLVGEYDFAIVQRNEWNAETDSIDENVQYLKAVPQYATILDTHEERAVWQSGAAGIPDFGEDAPQQTLTFNGVEVILQAGDPDEPDGILQPDPVPDKNRIILTVNGDPDALLDEDYTQAYVRALNALADQRGSEVYEFTFIQEGDSITAVAPERSGTLYNRAYFSGTMGVDTPRQEQLQVEGASRFRSVEKDQQAGLFRMLDTLKGNMEAGRQDELSNMLNDIDRFMNAILTVRSEVGAKSNRMELVINRIEDDTLNFRELISKIEDADMSKVVIELMNEENVYRAALNVGARVIQPTLLDFLR